MSFRRNIVTFLVCNMNTLSTLYGKLLEFRPSLMDSVRTTPMAQEGHTQHHQQSHTLWRGVTTPRLSGPLTLTPLPPCASRKPHLQPQSHKLALYTVFFPPESLSCLYEIYKKYLITASTVLNLNDYGSSKVMLYTTTFNFLLPMPNLMS